MKNIRSFILGLVVMTVGTSMSLFAPAVFMGPVQAEAAVIVTNTCTSTWQITGFAPAISGFDTVAINIESGTATNFVFMISEFQIYAGQISPQIIIEARDDSGALASGFNDTVVLSTSSSNGFFSVSPTIWSNTTIITFISGVGTFYYMDSTVGNPVITIDRAGLIAAIQVETITAAPETPALTSWISGIQVEVSSTETQVLFTFISDTSVVDTYYLVKINPDGTSETITIVGGNNTYIDTNIIGDTIYHYSVFGVIDGANTGAMSDSIAVGISDGGLILSGSGNDSLSFNLTSKEDTRASVHIMSPNATFGTETGFLKVNIRRISVAQLPVPAWAKKDVSNAYQIYCQRWSAGVAGDYVSQFAAPVELVLAYNIERNKVVGTNVRSEDASRRLSNFWWNGSSWTRMVSTSNAESQTLASQTYHFSYFCVADVKIQQAPGFAGYGAQPNPFSPNGDGYNDHAYFKFPNENSEAGVLTVFDLRGAVVYKADILAGQNWINWDGYYNVAGGGKTDLAEAGAYIWQTKIGSKVYNGIVVLVK